MNQELKGLIEGRIVHYVDLRGHYPAIILRVEDMDTGLCVLRVLKEGQDDSEADVEYSFLPIGGSWHWIEGSRESQSATPSP